MPAAFADVSNCLCGRARRSASRWCRVWAPADTFTVSARRSYTPASSPPPDGIEPGQTFDRAFGACSVAHRRGCGKPEASAVVSPMPFTSGGGRVTRVAEACAANRLPSETTGRLGAPPSLIARVGLSSPHDPSAPERACRDTGSTASCPPNGAGRRERRGRSSCRARPGVRGLRLSMVPQVRHRQLWWGGRPVTVWRVVDRQARQGIGSIRRRRGTQLRIGLSRSAL